jgi:2-alkenal reductase
MWQVQAICGLHQPVAAGLLWGEGWVADRRPRRIPKKNEELCALLCHGVEFLGVECLVETVKGSRSLPALCEVRIRGEGWSGGESWKGMIMEKRHFGLIAGLGCLAIVLLAIVVTVPLFLLPVRVQRKVGQDPTLTATPNPGLGATQEIIPTLTLPPTSLAYQPVPPEGSFTALYERLNPGVVNIQVYVERGGLSGSGAGSGFILDDEGHIVTNHHVVVGANQVTAIFHDSTEAEAEIVGMDDDSDLAIIQVDNLPATVRPLLLGDSDVVDVGQWVLAIGNPFGLGSSMSLGIVSAVGRMIPSGATPFAIPQAIQTDAAINPGNSGGPLLNLQGEVIGVNAQIASGGAPANAGVGFAIPSNVVRIVAPVLIQSGAYRWPWLGVEGGSVNLTVMEANDLGTQQGAYIDRVVPDGPADEAGLQGSSGIEIIEGVKVPVGGDVIVAIEGIRVIDFSDLLSHVAFKAVDDAVELTILRDGGRQQVTVELIARP